MNVLTDPTIMNIIHAPSDWTVASLLHAVSNAEPPFNALIDTGALITGFSNHQVAERLLDLGLSWCAGVVFMDDKDQKQILVRATGRVIPLSQCGIAPSDRFAFYDQIHTTGIDLKLSNDARAALTLGKKVFVVLVQRAVGNVC